MAEKQRSELIKKLSQLAEPDFGLLRLQFPEAHEQIDATGAVQHRVAQLIDWAESATGPGLQRLVDESEGLWPHMVGHLSAGEKASIVEQFSDPLQSTSDAGVTDEDFKSLVDRAIEAVSKGERSKYEVLAKLNRALPHRTIAAIQQQPLVQKLDTYLHLKHPDYEAAARDTGGAGLEDFRDGEAFSFTSGLEAFEIETRSVGPGREALAAPELIPILISVSDRDWDLKDVPDLVVVTRIGGVVGAKGTLRSLEALNVDARVMSVEASTPQQDRRLECTRSMSYVRAAEARAQVGRNGVDEDGDQALVGFIDAGIDVFQHCFRKSDGNTRILAIWDQTDPTGPTPPGFEGAGGTLFTAAKINAILAAGPAAHGANHPLRQVNCHGTHVASIAAGSSIPPSFPGGVAPEAGLLVVITGRSQFEAEMPDSLGYSLSHVTALAWLDQSALQAPGNLPIAVNISLGQNSGAHDGSSPLELACDEFTGGGRRAGRAIVKSAGNMRDRHSHASLVMSPAMGESLKWRNETGVGPQGVRLDAWFPSHVEFRFQLKAPQGDTLGPVDWHHLDVSRTFASGNRARMIYTRLHPDNGISRLVIEIQGGPAGTLSSGDWVLDLVILGGVTNVRFECWVDALDRSAVQFANHDEEQRTLSVPGTARTVITVGAIDTAQPVRVGDFSAYGLTRDGREKPELVAPGVAIMAACSRTDDQLRTESGTSMAAPHVTGAIALCFSACRRHGVAVPNAVQMAQALKNSAREFTGTHNPGRGFGDLNVAGLLATFLPLTS